MRPSNANGTSKVCSALHSCEHSMASNNAKAKKLEAAMPCKHALLDLCKANRETQICNENLMHVVDGS